MAIDDLPPPLPERYEVLDLVGEGATGAVWRAFDRPNQGEVAIKVVRANLALLPRFRARFAREVGLSAQVIHPRVVPVFDHGRLPDGRPYVVLAYANRGSLADLLDKRPPLFEALRLIDQVLEALGALHAQGLLHQDLKPENVLLHGPPDEPPDAWVADLGVAAELTELTIDRRAISGTPTWMAPEQLQGLAQELGPWSDLYPVGLLLHAMLAGTPHTAELTRRTLLAERAREAPPLPEGVPSALGKVIGNLLAPDPRERYDRAADVRRALLAATTELSAEVQARAIERSLNRATTTFQADLLPEAQETLVVPRVRAPEAGTPHWNRVPPGELPIVPPPEPGAGSPTFASDTLFVLREPPLIGRGAARRKLWAVAREVIATREPRVALVVGESGSGKSRLIQSVARALDEGGWAEAGTLRYHLPAGVEDGYRGAVQELLAPWKDTRFEVERRLTRWLARDHQRPLEAMAREAAVLARWCGYTREGEDPVNAAIGLTFLYRHLDARAWRGGAVLVLEDVHLAQAEGDGLAICEALLDRSVGERPVLVLASISSEALARDSRLAAKVAVLQRMGAVRVAAPRLPEPMVHRLLQEGLLLAPDLASHAAPVCAGSPSFAALLVRDWSARGLLERRGRGGFRLRHGTSLDEELPRDPAELCARRLEGALAGCEDREAVEVALAATVLAGQEPPLPVVRGVAEEGLDALLATGLVRQRGWRLVFEHSGVQRAARLRVLGRPDVPALHQRLAEAWEALGKQTGIAVDLPLGIHRLHAGQIDRAVVPLLRAAASAHVEGRTSLSLDAARLAVAAADRSGVRSAQVEARDRMAEALLQLDRPQEAETVLRGALGLGRLDRRSKGRIEVLLARASIARGDMDEGRRLLDTAATAFEATRDWSGLVDTAHGQGRLFRLEGRPDAAAERYVRMLRINRGKDKRLEVLGLVGLIEARIAAGSMEGVGGSLDRLRRVAQESGDTRNLAQATYTSGLVYLRRRMLDAAERTFRTARALAATLGSDRLYLACTNNLGEVMRYQGDLNAARGFYGQGARFAEERRWSGLAAVSTVNLALVELLSGGNEAEALVGRAERLLVDQPRHWAWLFVALLRAGWAAGQGDEASCRSWWSVAQEHGLTRIQSPDLWMPMERLAAAASRQGWHDLAHEASRLSRHAQTADVELAIEEEE